MDKSDRKAINLVMYYLAKRDHSVKELTEKLTRKEYAPEQIDAAILFAKENNWLKDPHELSRIVNRVLNEKNKSHGYIQQYLYKKGLPEVDADPHDEIEKAKKHLLKKYGRYGDFTFSESQKAYMFLRSKGFDSETIKKALKGQSHELE